MKRYHFKIIGYCALAVLFGGMVGYFLGTPEKGTLETGVEVSQTVPKQIIWTCSMHPQIRLPEPGLCPICGMQLIPLETGEPSPEEGPPKAIHLSPYAMKLAQIQTMPVMRKSVAKEVRLVGKVTYDESRIKQISSWIPGRIDRLFVDFTGMKIRKGDPLFSIYSPELLAAQEELLQIVRSHKALKPGASPAARERYKAMLFAIREKLRLWGLTAQQIQTIERQSRVKDHLTIYAPLGGTVVQRNMLEGDYVKTGTTVCTIADLSNVWVELAAYENDLLGIRNGLKVKIESEAYPGDPLEGTVIFIDPQLDEKMRTVGVRVNVPNPLEKFKPGMFVHADISVPVMAGEVTPEEEGLPLVIPHTAPLVTGKRAVVYVTDPQVPTHFESREIVLGPRAGDYYVVKSGLTEGETVVTKGNFKIDSALQILAGASMMNSEAFAAELEGEKVPPAAPPVHHHGAAPSAPAAQPSHGETPSTPSVHVQHERVHEEDIQNLLDAYFRIQDALARDNLDNSKEAAATLNEMLRSNLKKLSAAYPDFKEWNLLAEKSRALAEAGDIGSARRPFYDLSEGLIRMLQALGPKAMTKTTYVYYCPMVFNNKGGRWLQDHEGTENPYFGAAMFACGALTETFPPQEKK